MLGLVLLLVWQTPAAAWNRTGHWITAVSAYDALRQNDPAALEEAVALLRRHPAAEDWLAWTAEFPQMDAGLILFMQASTFPDDARRGKYEAFDRPDWHYINYAIEPGRTSADLASSRALTGRLPEALAENLALLHDRGRPAVERAVALSWVLHLVGDLHQPLHTTGLVNADFPAGDRGGNDVFVRDPQRPELALRLHALWDDALGAPTRDMAQVTALARATAERHAMPTRWGSSADWLAESFAASFELGYAGGTLRYAVLADVLPALPPTAAAPVTPLPPGPQPLRGDAAPALPEGYVPAMRRFCEQRLVLAGWRIARTLQGRSESP
ncbi:MAG TPA: S1/P1 nuclease [Burkholderiaceae bacterium]|nr:S1/P1 nuclease [Burkholderiaceae bacterium]